LPIRDLVSDINSYGRETVFTTSSCSGRVSLVSELTKGKRTKGDAKWVLMSHEPIGGDEIVQAIEKYLAEADTSLQTLTLRFEPFILAMECAQLEVASALLKVGRDAGFRESGIQIGKRITLSIRCSIRLELPVCKNGRQLVTKEYIHELAELCDEKFDENFQRIDRFHRLLKPKLEKLCATRRDSESRHEGGGTRALVAQRRDAKALKDLLKAKKWLNQSIRPAAEGGKIAFPVTSDFEDASVEELKKALGIDLELITLDEVEDSNKAVSPYEVLRRKVRDSVPAEIAEELLVDLPRKWERLGDALLVPKNSLVHEFWRDPERSRSLWPMVARTLNCKKIGRQREVQDNEIRESSAELLWPREGADGWVKHLENGIFYSFDFTKCMFSSGNGTEKLRVAGFPCKDEVVLDMFAGIGYFTLPYLVKAGAKHLYACEWNPVAVSALKKNLRLNGCEDRCTVLEGNCAAKAPVGVAHRVNLGLIPDSSLAWDAAVRSLVPEGGWLHVHTNCGSSKEEIDEAVEKMRTRFVELARESGREDAKVELGHVEKVKSYAPKVLHVVVDLLLR